MFISLNCNIFWFLIFTDRPNITNTICTTKDRSVRLNCDVFLYDKSPALEDLYWTKNERKLDIQGSGGKYSGEVSPEDPSLTINNVNEHDAGNYQLTAINSVGPTKSDVIVLGNNFQKIYSTKFCLIEILIISRYIT